MKIKLIGAVAALVVSAHCWATPAQQETLDELFQVTNAEKMLDTSYVQMENYFREATKTMGNDETQKPIKDKYLAKTMALVKEELTWKKLNQPMAQTYASVYSDEELKEIIQFYKTPTGRKMLQKMPELMQATLGMVQKMMQDVMPKLQALTKEMAQELDKDTAASKSSGKEPQR